MTSLPVGICILICYEFSFFKQQQQKKNDFLSEAFQLYHCGSDRLKGELWSHPGISCALPIVGDPGDLEDSHSHSWKTVHLLVTHVRGSDFSMNQNNPVTARLLLHLELSLCFRVWGSAQDFAFLTVPRDACAAGLASPSRAPLGGGKPIPFTAGRTPSGCTSSWEQMLLISDFKQNSHTPGQPGAPAQHPRLTRAFPNTDAELHTFRRCKT